MAGTLLTTVPAQASATIEETSVPVVLPPVWESLLPDNQFVTASDQYVMHRRVWDENGAFPGYPVVRLSDGQVVQDFKPDPAASGFPRLTGDAILQSYDHPFGANYRVDVLDAETGALRGSLVTPTAEWYVASGADWMLTIWRPTESTSAGRLRFLDGHSLDIDLQDDTVDGASRVIGTVGTIVYLQQNSTLGALDLSTGAVTRLVAPNADEVRPYGLWQVPFVTASRIVEINHDWNTGTDTAVWRNFADSVWQQTPLTLPAQGEGGIYAFADDLILAIGPHNEPKTLYRMDLDTGEVSPGFGQAREVTPTGAARLVVTLDEDPDDALGVVADDGLGVQRIADLPRVPEAMFSPWLDSDTVSALVNNNDTWPASTAADGSAPWAASSRRFTTAGDVRLEEIPDPVGNPTSQWELTWPGGSRIIDAASAVLGHGGELVVVNGQIVQRVRPAADGSVAVTSPFGAAQVVADGDWVWLAPGADHMVRGFDANDPTNTREVPTTVGGFGCSNTPQARDGFMLLTCSLGWSYVVDLSGQLPVWRVPMSNPGATKPKLGNGFIAWSYHRSWTPEAPAGDELRIADLTADHRTTAITDFGGGGYYYYGVDEAGGTRVAYLNKSGLMAVRDVTRADATAPVLTGGGSDQADVVASTDPIQAHFAQSWSDTPMGIESASGLASYDVRTRARTADSDWSVWESSGDALPAAITSREVQPGSGVCFSSRARDAAGNVSDWSDPDCTLVDGTAPQLKAITGPGTFGVAGPDGNVRFGYSATDDFGVASYDVQTRVAAPGSQLGPWIDRASATTSTELVKHAAPGSEVCARFRARDLAGNLTGWSAARCTSIAYDDRALAVSGPTARATSALALHGTVTVLKAKGAVATMTSGQHGRILAVWLLRGPDQGVVDVRVGATVVARLAAAAPTWRRVLIQVPLDSSGPVRFIAIGTRPIRFDGFTVGR